MPGSAMARADRAWTAPTELFEPGVTQMYKLLIQLALSCRFAYRDNKHETTYCRMVVPVYLL